MDHCVTISPRLMATVLPAAASGEDEIWIEPWRAAAFPIVKDLMVNRAAFDRIIESGGYITVSTGSAPEAIGDRGERGIYRA